MIVNKSLKRICCHSNDTRLLVYGISSLLAKEANYRKATGKSYSKKESTKQKCDQPFDIYGVFDPVTNIPHIKFAVSEHETPKEKKFREFKESLRSWHQQFWRTHNESFKKDKRAYLNKRPNPQAIMDEKYHADDLSMFYRDFLDKNYRIHLNYQREWYKKNFKCLWYGFQVQVEKLFKSYW